MFSRALTPLFVRAKTGCFQMHFFTDFVGDHHQSSEFGPALVSGSPAEGRQQGTAPSTGPLQHLSAAVQKEARERGGDHHLQVRTYTSYTLRENHRYNHKSRININAHIPRSGNMQMSSITTNQ